VEGILTVAAYVGYMDYCASGNKTSSHFKGLAHRSAGPLWALLRNIVRGSGKRLLISAALAELFDEPNYNILNGWIDEIANTKHDKKSSIDFVNFIGILGNVIAKIFNEVSFGVFESVTAKRFVTGQFRGTFRSIMGSSQTFIHACPYEGAYAFSDTDVFIVDMKKGTAINLSPLFIWGLNTEFDESGDPDLYEFDSVKNAEFSFKAVQHRAEQVFRADGALGEIWSKLKAMRDTDPRVAVQTELTFLSPERS
jgi:hypothetical protein